MKIATIMNFRTCILTKWIILFWFYSFDFHSKNGINTLFRFYIVGSDWIWKSISKSNVAINSREFIVETITQSLSGFISTFNPIGFCSQDEIRERDIAEIRSWNSWKWNQLENCYTNWLMINRMWKNIAEKVTSSLAHTRMEFYLLESIMTLTRDMTDHLCLTHSVSVIFVQSELR